MYQVIMQAKVDGRLVAELEAAFVKNLDTAKEVSEVIDFELANSPCHPKVSRFITMCEYAFMPGVHYGTIVRGL